MQNYLRKSQYSIKFGYANFSLKGSVTSEFQIIISDFRPTVLLFQYMFLLSIRLSKVFQSMLSQLRTEVLIEKLKPLYKSLSVFYRAINCTILLNNFEEHKLDRSKQNMFNLLVQDDTAAQVDGSYLSNFVVMGFLGRAFTYCRVSSVCLSQVAVEWIVFYVKFFTDHPYFRYHCTVFTKVSMKT